MSLSIEDLPQNKKIILFDGYCNLCDSSIQWIIKHDKKDKFKYVSLQSELGQNTIKYLNIRNDDVDSIIFI